MDNLQEFLIALGGNLDEDPKKVINIMELALSSLNCAEISVSAVSRYFRTPCFPKGAGHDYVNAAAILRTAYSPHAVLETLHEIEAEFGRERLQRWGTRSLDLDLIAGGDMICPDVTTQKQWMDLPLEQQMTMAPEQLILPHPRLQDRAFVLVPLADIAPQWTHPVTKMTVSQMLAGLPDADVSEVVAL